MRLNLLFNLQKRHLSQQFSKLQSQVEGLDSKFPQQLVKRISQECRREYSSSEKDPDISLSMILTEILSNGNFRKICDGTAENSKESTTKFSIKAWHSNNSLFALFLRMLEERMIFIDKNFGKNYTKLQDYITKRDVNE